MEDDLKESNIAKNREFNSVVRVYLIISIGITVISFFVSEPIKSLLNNKIPWLFWLISLVITIWLLWWTFSGGECPNCAARKHENRLSTDLIGETFLGNKTKKHTRVSDSSTYYKTYAVFNRTYHYHSICKYCDYEWEGTETKREEEDL